jgi:hypothetical protein
MKPILQAAWRGSNCHSDPFLLMLKVTAEVRPNRSSRAKEFFIWTEITRWSRRNRSGDLRKKT